MHRSLIRSDVKGMIVHNKNFRNDGTPIDQTRTTSPFKTTEINIGSEKNDENIPHKQRHQA